MPTRWATGRGPTDDENTGAWARAPRDRLWRRPRALPHGRETPQYKTACRAARAFPTGA